MKSIKLCLLALLTTLTMSSCQTNTSSELSDEPTSSESSSLSESVISEESSDERVYNPINHDDAFIISNIKDTFTENETTKVYKLFADHDDRYAFFSKTYNKLTVLNEYDEVITEGENEIAVELKKNEHVYLKVENLETDNNKIDIEAMYINNPVKLPYDVNYEEQVIDTSYSDATDLLKAAQVNYVKRTGGTYVYSNNPELFKDEDVNTCLMRNNDLSGDVYMAFEHANYSSKLSTWLGYRLVNNSDSDVYVTVENIGFQAGGSWFGQKAWFDFYNTKFELPSDYLVDGVISSKYSGYDYGYFDYTPRIYTPTTYKLPVGEAFFVIGGQTKVNYNKINVGKTANLALERNKCSNGQVKFKVTNGTVDGLMIIYNDVTKISNDMQEVGYVTLRNGADFGRQYQGIGHHQGVIDNNMMWEFNDNTRSQNLPVKYTNKYASDISKRTPYSEYDNKEHNKEGVSWMTHLNPQNDHDAVGTDLVDFICNTTDGKEVIIDSYHADGSGEAANTANWMIEYHDNFTFVNRGNETRTIILKLRDNGTLATLIRDAEGNVLQTYYSVGIAQKAYNEYRFEVAPQSSLQLTLDYLLVACSYGNVLHQVQLI